VRQMVFVGDRVALVTALNRAAMSDRNAYLVSAERVVPLGPASLVSVIGSDRVMTVERERAVQRDAQTGSVVMTYEVSNITALEVSLDGEQIALGLRSGVIERIESKTGKRLGILVGHASAVQTMSFTSDGKRLISMAYDRNLRIWDLPRARELFHYVGIEGTPRTIRIS